MGQIDPKSEPNPVRCQHQCTDRIEVMPGYEAEKQQLPPADQSRKRELKE